MLSFLVSASITGRIWRRLVRILVLFANIAVWCVRFDVMSMIRWALPKRSRKPLMIFATEAMLAKPIVNAEKRLEKIEAVLGATLTRISNLREKRNAAKIAAQAGALSTAKSHLRAIAELDAEITYLEQHEKALSRNILDMEAALVKAKQAAASITSDGSVIQKPFVDLASCDHIADNLATNEYAPSEADIKTRIGQLEEDGALVVIDYQEGFTDGPTATEYGETIHDIREKIEAGQLDEAGDSRADGRLPSELLRAGWSRNYTAETADGRSVCSDAPDAVAWNLSGAVNQTLGVFSDQWQAYYKELGKLLAARMTTELNGDALVYKWNRQVATGQDEVVALAEEVERRLSLACEECNTVAEPRTCDKCGAKFCPRCDGLGSINGFQCNKCRY